MQFTTTTTNRVRMRTWATSASSSMTQFVGVTLLLGMILSCFHCETLWSTTTSTRTTNFVSGFMTTPYQSRVFHRTTTISTKPITTTTKPNNKSSSLKMIPMEFLDPTIMMTTTTSMIPQFMDTMMTSLSTTTTATLGGTFADTASTIDAAVTSTASASSSSSLLLSFTDQGNNLAGIFFQLSLVPYLLFCYFLSYRANRLPTLTNFGFQYVLLFVLSTIPSGIITRNVYGLSLANTDWLHGSAELLLTVANILVVLGLKEAMTNPILDSNKDKINQQRFIALGFVGLFAATCFVGTNVITDGHTPFLFGIGNLPLNFVQQDLSFVSHTEPINALSIPTWMIHFSSVYEYLFAMGLIWDYSITTQNEKWKGLTWGMLPLHVSGVCACTYHFFYNPAVLQFLVSTQAGCTLLGNITCMIAAYRIAVSNGWTIQDEISFIPFLPKSSTSPKGLVADGLAAMPLQVTTKATTSTNNNDSTSISFAPPSVTDDSTTALTIKLATVTIASSYLVKYGELGLDLPFTPNPVAATAIILGIPSIVAYTFYQKSVNSNDNNENNSVPFTIQLPSFLSKKNEDGSEASPSLSFADVKKFGVAGTVAYVITELLFWIVAFPVAATALYQSTGHWPDVFTDNNDRGAVLAFIFAGANIARLFVPIRLGAALALAPWVDENIINRAE